MRPSRSHNLRGQRLRANSWLSLPSRRSTNTMTSWLQRQRKQTLLDLSSEAGLAHEEDSLKDEIVEALDEHLQRHATRLSRNAVFEPYYGARSRTPHKTRSSSGAMAATSDDGDVRTIVRGRGRRATKVKQEHEYDRAYSLSSTPRGLTANAILATTPKPTLQRTSFRPGQQSQRMRSCLVVLQAGHGAQSSRPRPPT